jgi:ring-1,2-phenylacetyl-CoA epoxidase subunit PaaC
MVIEVLSAANINIPNDSYMQSGSKKGIHTEHLGYILTDMQYLPRAYPEAKW